jgi:hypothetical protein
MRAVVMLALSGMFAVTAPAQYRHSNIGAFRSFAPPLGGRSGLGAPQTPGVGLNGLPSFSTRQYQFNCFDCRPVRNRRSSGVVLPFFGGAMLPAYPLMPDQAPPLAYDSQSMPAPPPSVGVEIDRLQSEVNELKQQREAERYQTTPEADAVRIPATPAEPEEPPTIVVLRDGRKLAVRNYAIMGHTFWDFTARPAKQLPISEIDVAASQHANEAQGTEFPLLAPPVNK